MTYIEQRIEKLERKIKALERRIDELEHKRALPDLLSTSEAADALSLSQQTIKNWIHEGKLPAQKIGRNWKIRRKDVLAQLPDGDG